jgi:predicted ATPase
LVQSEEPSGFAELLRSHRRTARLSQQELAERSRLSLEAVSALERGLRSRPRSDTVRLLARALNLSEAETDALMLARARPRRSPRPSSRNGYRLLGRARPMVGRTRELGWARSRIASSDSRLITFTGPPGVGKTRLAEAVLREVGDDFEAVTPIDLTKVAVAEVLISAISAAVGAPAGSGLGLDELIAFIGDTRRLLLLDNFEHLLQTGPLIAELVVRCPQLRVLVTSRSSLSLRDEQELSVRPLPIGHAVIMFTERVRSHTPSFKLPARQRPLIQSICLKVDCLPLGIELAAPWLKLMTAEALLDRLGSPLELLVGGPIDLPERQRSMRAALDGSYELLDADERALFKLLSVFPGGASLEAVEAIGQECSIPMPLSVLARLTDKSLAMTTSENGALHISMLRTLREYGRHLLETSVERDAVHRAHSRWCSSLAVRGLVEAG